MSYASPPRVLLGLMIAAVTSGCSDGGGAQRGKRGAPVAVAVAPIERGPIALRSTFSGSLEATAQLTVAPKIAGRLEQVLVDLGASVQRGQVVAKLDDDLFRQAVHEAAAELSVAKASKMEAVSAFEAARRELERGRLLLQEKIISPSAFDLLQADHDAKQARIALADAQVERANATLQAARIRLSQTEVVAQWEGGSEHRVVAERYVDGGEVLNAGAALMRLVELDPIVGVISVPEKDYGFLAVEQTVEITTAAHGAEVFTGTIARIAPVFAPGSRQARVELLLPNADARLKPGMFISATVTLRTEDNAVIVPEAAVVNRADHTGVFVVDATGERVEWVPVQVGIREAERVQVTGEGLTGSVVTMGQQLIDHGSRVNIPQAAGEPVSSGEGAQ